MELRDLYLHCLATSHPHQGAAEELWAVGELALKDRSSFRFKEARLSLSYQKVPLSVAAAWASPRTRSPRRTFIKRCLKDLMIFHHVEALVRIFD